MKNDAYSEEMAAFDFNRIRRRIPEREKNYLSQIKALEEQVEQLERKIEEQKFGNSVEVDMLQDLIAEARNEAEYFRNVVAILQRHDELRYPISVSEHKFPWE